MVKIPHVNTEPVVQAYHMWSYPERDMGTQVSA
jgi:hypothetical protein